MSSGFVSGGTTDDPIKRDDEWSKVQLELETKRKQKLEQGKQEGGKTLFQVLQENKEAKQEAFEESIRLKNQFRALDEDEVEFLDSVLESTRAKEAAIKKDTSEQLEAFRKQQEAAEKAALEASRAEEDDGSQATSTAHRDQWSTTSKKRRRDKDPAQSAPFKLRKPSSIAQADRDDKPHVPQPSPSSSSPRLNLVQPKQSPSTQENVSAPTLGLAGYDSDDD